MSYPPSYQTYTPPGGAPQRTNVLAIISLVSAFFISLVAVITGHIALSQIKRTGENGKGLAIAGLVLGYLGLFLGFIILVSVAANAGRVSTDYNNQNNNPIVVPSQPVETAPVVPSSEPSQIETQPPTDSQPSDDSNSSDLTLAQQNAVDKATSYLEFESFSRQGLIDQLKFEEYSTKDATFAVDYLKVDWNDQAAKKAAEYLQVESFSKKELIEQLEFDKFTPSQAAHGAAAVGY